MTLVFAATIALGRFGAAVIFCVAISSARFALVGARRRSVTVFAVVLFLFVVIFRVVTVAT
jgi:hypothetical protein